VTRDRQTVRYEGLRDYNGRLCVGCLHRYYRPTYIAFASLVFVFLVALAFCLLGNAGTSGYLALVALGLPAVVLGGNVINANFDRAGAHYVRKQAAKDGITGTAPGKAPA
jgi:hypothetical protein